ncbi:ATP-dependent helicase [Nakamurella lactea]|uniref:ATP-dependent helicase n=1 Tax=Nakamurella lactea TaxID=459515 RepID=UPI0003F4E41A|nr:ATP-dependent helicase [Nakamurella lactea]
MIESEWRAGLDDRQRAAAEHDAGPLIIAAGAGTGKTRTLTARVAGLLESGVPPERILLLTFTRRAATSMTSRAAAMCADTGAGGRIWGGTFHAVAHRMAAEHAQHLGLTDVTVLDPADVIDLLDLTREESGLTGTDRRMPTSKTIADVYSRAINTGTPARTVMSEQFPWCLAHADQINDLLRDFTARKRSRGLLDFDDLLLTWRALLAHPDTGARLRERWDWVLVDEYQDVNQVQVDIVRLLRPDGSGLTVVGDDAQAVYGFRGATAGQLLSLHADLPEATLIRLERNFRSTQQILNLANVARPGELRLDLVADRDAVGARPALLHCENGDDEARQVAEAVLAAHSDGLDLREQAVLMRTGSHSNQLEIELKVRNIPFVKFGGIGYLDTAHVRDLLAAFRIALNPADEVSWYRLLTRHRAIGKAHARRLAGVLAGAEPAQYAEAVAGAPAKARTALTTTLTGLALAQEMRTSAEVARVCHDVVLPLLAQHYVDWERRGPDVAELVAAAEVQASLSDFVAQVTIDPATVSSDWAKKPQLDEDYLTLSTVHSAKGLEWSVVHVLRACDGSFPSDMALSTPDGLAEEQRLFYVAITRAKDSLRIYTPARLPDHPTSLHARHVLTKPSRFLTAAALAEMDSVRPAGPPAPALAAAGSATVVLPSLDDLFA